MVHRIENLRMQELSLSHTRIIIRNVHMYYVQYSYGMDDVIQIDHLHKSTFQSKTKYSRHQFVHNNNEDWILDSMDSICSLLCSFKCFNISESKWF